MTGSSVSLECPICAQRLSESAESCDGCGYPVALHPEARRALADGDPPAAVSPILARGTATMARRAAAGVPRARDQTTEACNRAALELRGHVLLLQQLGGNSGTYSSEMRQAALVQAEGKSAEALDLLRAAGGRADEEIIELFARRAQELEARANTLTKDGVRAEIEEPLERLQAALVTSNRPEAARLVVETDRRIALLEQDWRGLHTLLQQINELQAGARGAGKGIPEVDDDLGQVRALLARPQIDAEILDSAAQIAARALMMLHEALPAILEQDLDLHATALHSYPAEHEGARKAKAVHGEASRHLRRGRLNEASRLLEELRRMVIDLESGRASAPPMRPIAEPVPVETSTEDSDGALSRLLTKARSLASRVRALAPESEIAYEAAGEIRRATELLRARKLPEAEAALTHLMRTLDSEPLREA
ncbi:MAG: hypothetical protein L3J96_03380 [Thermoplasmata archaeon]|nr:hypothetical protein [Thermoplasmata archaeon]